MLVTSNIQSVTSGGQTAAGQSQEKMMIRFLVQMRLAILALALSFGATTMAAADPVYLEITLHIDGANRAAAAEVYTTYKEPFLTTVPGAMSKQLLVRDDDVQVLHGFASVEAANAYLTSDLFTKDVVGGLAPLLTADPEIRIYTAN
jgi:hypothetical protein